LGCFVVVEPFLRNRQEMLAPKNKCFPAWWKKRGSLYNFVIDPALTNKVSLNRSMHALRDM
jgi:hypothetical protein